MLYMLTFVRHISKLPASIKDDNVHSRNINRHKDQSGQGRTY